MRGELRYYLNRLQVNGFLHFYKSPIHLKEEPLCICNSSLFVLKVQVFAYLIHLYSLQENSFCLFIQSPFTTNKILFVPAIYFYLLQRSNSTHLNKGIGVLHYLLFALYMMPASFRFFTSSTSHLFTFSLLFG